jgi:SPP1 family predicted phage head-tail adaptor
MRAGELRQRVTLQEKISRQNEFGEEVVEYADLATLWALVEPVSSVEAIQQQQAAAIITHQVTLRYRSGVLPTMRLAWADGSVTRALEIVSLTQTPKRTELNLLVSEVAIESVPFVVGQSAIGGPGAIGSVSAVVFTVGQSQIGGTGTVE